MKILVTGGAGFIGTHLCEALTRAGHDVRVLDVAKPTRAIHGVRYTQGDVRNLTAVTDALDGVDAVYHFAAMVSVLLCQESPVESYETNLLATAQLLDAIRKESAKRSKKIRIVFSGSSVVYGDQGPKPHAISEKAATPRPLSFYGAQKLASEHAIQLFHHNYGVPATIFRFFNVYGPGQDPKSPYSGVISIFARALREGLPVRLNGGGVNTRDFVSVHDVVAACVHALETPAACEGLPINIGSGHSISVRGVADEMARALGARAKLEDAPPRNGDILHSLADISCARDAFGWSPRVSLADGLKELLSEK